jgi:protein-S-isoprenylcysteine O-methyltransferase Ste14
MKILHAVLRPGFGVCLFLSQFTSNRNTYFTNNLYMILLGVIITIAGVSLTLAASIYIRRANETGEMATSGPFQYIRHPIYISVYLISIGLGFLFFAWLWFLVMVVFIPLWWLESKEEEKEMLDKYGEKYVDYQKRTKMFIPGVA